MDDNYGEALEQALVKSQDYIDRLIAVAYCWTCGELLGLGNHTWCRGYW